MSAACVQAIQARNVLRGTVAELVKETRRQESEGEALGFTAIILSSMSAQLRDLAIRHGHGTCFVKPRLQAVSRHTSVLLGTAALQLVTGALCKPLAACAGSRKEAAAGLSQQAPAAAPGKRARAVEPGSFLNLMINSKHSNGEPFSDMLASSQAFTFLLVSCPSDSANAPRMPYRLNRPERVLPMSADCWRCGAPDAAHGGYRLRSLAANLFLA